MGREEVAVFSSFSGAFPSPELGVESSGMPGLPKFGSAASVVAIEKDA